MHKVTVEENLRIEVDFGRRLRNLTISIGDASAHMTRPRGTQAEEKAEVQGIAKEINELFREHGRFRDLSADVVTDVVQRCSKCGNKWELTDDGRCASCEDSPDDVATTLPATPTLEVMP